MSCDIRIGTSGYHYRHWKGNFYPANISTSAMLPYYLHYFDTLELNNTFYVLLLQIAVLEMKVPEAAKAALTELKRLTEQAATLVRSYQGLCLLLMAIMWFVNETSSSLATAFTSIGGSGSSSIRAFCAIVAASSLRKVS